MLTDPIIHVQKLFLKLYAFKEHFLEFQFRFYQIKY
jgi:hypothetical protein